MTRRRLKQDAEEQLPLFDGSKMIDTGNGFSPDWIEGLPATSGWYKASVDGQSEEIKRWFEPGKGWSFASMPHTKINDAGLIAQTILGDIPRTEIQVRIKYKGLTQPWPFGYTYELIDTKVPSEPGIWDGFGEQKNG